MSIMQMSSDVARVVRPGLGAKGMAAYSEFGMAAAGFKWDDEAVKAPSTQDKISFSEAAIAAFEEQLAAQAKGQANTSTSNTDRYAAAQAEGKNADAWIEQLKNKLDRTKQHAELEKFLAAGPQEVDMMEVHKKLYGPDVNTVSSKQGTVVTVEETWARQAPYPTRITRSDGLQVTINVSDDVRINDLEDGSLSIYFPATGKNCIFDPAGVMRVEEDEPNQSGTGGDDIIINVNGSVVNGGEGDDTIFNFANNASIEGGNGDDTVFVNTSSGNTIAMGNGNDRLVGRTISDSQIDMGTGDNVVSMQNITDSSLRAGDGNNEIFISKIVGKRADSQNQDAAGSLILGNGNNSINVYEITGGAKVQVGDGHNTLKTEGIGVSGGSSIHMGNGNNDITARGVSDSSTLDVGDGNNSIFAYNVSDNSTVNIGDGNNTYVGSSVANDSHISLGNGGNTIWLTGGVHNQSTVSSGAGDDIIHVSYVLPGGSIDAGAGNDIIHTESVTGGVSGGAGDDIIIVEGPAYGSVHGDAGTNTVVIGRDALDKNTFLLSDALQSLRKAQMAVGRYAAQAGMRF